MRILVTRGAGHGDVLGLTSILPGLRERYPDAIIDFRADTSYNDLLWLNPYIRRIRSYHEDCTGYDLYIEPDHGREWNDWIEKVQCRMAGVPFGEPQLVLSRQELAEVPHEPQRVVVGGWTNALERRYLSMQEACLALRDTYRLVQIDNGPDLGIEWPKLDIRQAAAYIHESACYFGVSTSFGHICNTMKKPMILVLGPTGPENAYMPNTILLRNPRGHTSWTGSGITYPVEGVVRAFRTMFGEIPPSEEFEYTDSNGYLIGADKWTSPIPVNSRRSVS